MALEPEWEAKFEPNSYGFRPGRSCHDAIEAIYLSINKAPTGKYVLDADISKCFDNIDHDVLIKKLDTWPKMQQQIQAWLKAGVLSEGRVDYPESDPKVASLAPCYRISH
jgi:RNA-directed DNA polymerase